MPALTRRRALTAGAAVAATAGLHTRAVAAPHTTPVPTSASAHEQDHAHGHDLGCLYIADPSRSPLRLTR
ncbi:hypothetical protein [Streptomyces sp. NPDC002547]